MSVTRTPHKDALTCAVCLKPGPALDVDHIVNRGAGGSTERDVPANKINLCRECHSLKTLGKIKTWVRPGDNGVYVYSWKRAGADVAIRTPVRVDTRHNCLVPCDKAEPTDVSSLKVQQGSALSQAGEGPTGAVLEPYRQGYPLNGPRSPGQGPAEAEARPMVRKRQPSPAYQTTGADEQSVTPLVGTVGSSSAPVGGEGGASQSSDQPPTDLRVPRRIPAPRPSPSPLSLICQEGMRLVYWGLKLKDASDEWRWRIGDWLVQMEEDLGESAYQYCEPVKEAFGYDAIRQYKSVAERVTRVTRVPELPWSHHRAVASLDETGQKAALLTAQEEGLSSREVAAMVRPEPPERERHACPLCQYEHWVVVREDWMDVK